MNSWYVRQVAHRAERTNVAPDEASLSIVRRVEARPAQFPVQLAEVVDGVVDDVGGPTTSLSQYIGRVLEVSADEVTATMWEIPGGTETIATLSIERHLDGAVPIPGDLVHLATWVELPGDGREEIKVRGTLERRELSDDEKERIATLLTRVDTK